VNCKGWQNLRIFGSSKFTSNLRCITI